MRATSPDSNGFEVDLPMTVLGPCGQKTQFLSFCHDKVVDQGLWQDTRHKRACLEPVDGRSPIGRQLRQVVIIGISRNGCRGRHLIFETYQGRGEYACKNEVGIDITASNAMLNATSKGVAAGDADRGGAVFIGPTGPGGGMSAGDKPRVTTCMRGENQRAVGHRGQASRDG